MLTVSVKFVRNAAYLFKLVRISLGWSHVRASNATHINEKMICDLEVGYEKADIDTYIALIEGYSLPYHFIFKHYDTIPLRKCRKRLDFLGKALGIFLRLKVNRFLSNDHLFLAWQAELKRLGGFSPEDEKLLIEIQKHYSSPNTPLSNSLTHPSTSSSNLKANSHTSKTLSQRGLPCLPVGRRFGDPAETKDILLPGR